MSAEGSLPLAAPPAEGGGGDGLVGSALPSDLSKLTLVYLKGELRARGLRVSGKKAVLVERLQENINAGGPATFIAPPPETTTTSATAAAPNVPENEQDAHMEDVEVVPPEPVPTVRFYVTTIQPPGDVSIVDLPYEVLAYMATWLDMHDLRQRVSLVCKLFSEIAKDPYTWAQIVVRPCTYGELKRVMFEHPSVTIIDNVFGRLDEVVALCPKLRVGSIIKDLKKAPVTELDTGAFPVSFEQLEARSLLDSAAMTSRESLRSLRIVPEGNVAVTPTILSSYSVLTSLDMPGFFSHDPTSLPLLTTLKTDSQSLNNGTWAEFVYSHEGLGTLELFMKTPALPSTPMPTNLHTLRMRCATHAAPDPVAMALLLRANQGLRTLRCAPWVDLTVLSEIASLPNLTHIEYLPVSNSVTSKQLKILDGKEYKQLGFGATVKYPRGALGYVTHLDRVDQSGYVMKWLGPKLRDLVVLDLYDVNVSEPHGLAIGTHCTGVRHVILTDIKGKGPDLIAPALKKVETAKIVGKTYWPSIMSAVCRSPNLTRLEVNLGKPRIGAAFAHSLVGYWKGRHIHSFEFTPVDRYAMAHLEELIATGARFNILTLNTAYLKYYKVFQKMLDRVEAKGMACVRDGFTERFARTDYYAGAHYRRYRR